MTRVHTGIWIVLAAPGLALVGCGEDDVQGSLGPVEQTPDGNDGIGPLPIGIGEKFLFNFVSTLHQDPNNTNEDIDAVGAACLRVESIDQGSYTEQAVIQAATHISGQTTDEVFVRVPQSNQAMTPAEADAALGDLWGKALVGASRNNGYGSPVNAAFNTRVVPIPPNLGFLNTPFFDPRVDNTATAAWGGYGGTDAVSSVRGQIFAFFTATLGIDPYLSPNADIQEVRAAPDCAGKGEPTCLRPSCHWDTNVNACFGVEAMRLRFRDTLDNTRYGQAEVIRDVALELSARGYLLLYEEELFADTNAAASVSITGASPSKPNDGRPWGRASITHAGAWATTDECAY